MPLILNGKTYPEVYFGGLKDLTKMAVQVIKLTITFPHVASGSDWINSPVEINLGREIGLSSLSQPYVVEWDVPANPDTSTLSNRYAAYQHKKIFSLETGPVFEKDFIITIYGPRLLRFDGNTYEAGTSPTGYKVVSTEVSLSVN